MKSIKQIRLAFLAETIAHYNLYNRAWNEGGVGNGCTYSPIEDVSEGCAIGRHIKDKGLCKLLDTSEYGGVSNTKTFDALPSNLKKLGQPFLNRIQGLHDDEKNWDAKGLTPLGLLRVENIKLNLVD